MQKRCSRSRSWIVLAGLMLSLVSPASETEKLSHSPTQTLEKNSLSHFCSTMVFSTNKTLCQEKSGRFDPNALKHCEGEPFDSDKLACLDGIRNVTYNAEAGQLCLTMNQRPEQGRCFAIIGNRPQLTAGAVANCQTEPSEASKNTCLMRASRKVPTAIAE